MSLQFLTVSFGQQPPLLFRWTNEHSENPEIQNLSHRWNLNPKPIALAAKYFTTQAL